MSKLVIYLYASLRTLAIREFVLMSLVLDLRRNSQIFKVIVMPRNFAFLDFKVSDCIIVSWDAQIFNRAFGLSMDVIVMTSDRQLVNIVASNDQSIVMAINSDSSAWSVLVNLILLAVPLNSFLHEEINYSIFRGFGVLGFWGFGVLGFWL